MKSLSRSMGLVILLASAAYGASGGTISGTVKDPGGAPFKGAFVRARNENKTKIAVTVLSDKQGHYRIENLSPGGYEVFATAIGYKSDPRAGVKVAAGGSASLDFALQKGMVRWSDVSAYQARKLLPEGKGKALFVEHCLACHGLTRIAGTRRDEAGWLLVVKLMRELDPAHPFTDQEAADILSYANTVFGMDSKLPRSPAELPEYKEVVRPFSDEAMKIVYVDYELAGPNSFPWSAFPDKDGKLWMPYFGGANRIGRLDPNTGEVQEFRLPNQAVPADIHSAAPAPDGTVWFSEQSTNKLGKLDPRTQTITEYQAAYAPGKEGFEPRTKHTILIDPKGYVWATGRPLSRFDPKTEKFTYFPEVAHSYGIVLDQGGNVWFADNHESHIGKIDAKTGKLTTYAVPTPKAFPRRMQVDSEGFVWFTEYLGNKIGRFDPKTETFKEYPLPGSLPTPYALGIDRNNHIWYSSYEMDVIGQLDPKTGQVIEYPFPYPENTMREFFFDPQGRMWFGSPANNKVGYFIPIAGNGTVPAVRKAAPGLREAPAQGE